MSATSDYWRTSELALQKNPPRLHEIQNILLVPSRRVGPERNSGTVDERTEKCTLGAQVSEIVWDETTSYNPSNNPVLALIFPSSYSSLVTWPGYSVAPAFVSLFVYRVQNRGVDRRPNLVWPDPSWCTVPRASTATPDWLNPKP